MDVLPVGGRRPLGEGGAGLFARRLVRGVGGAVADAIGERLSRLAQSNQILVVTHSPQVASRGHAHWKVRKADVDGHTRTSIDVLEQGPRQEEIARMLSGATVTDEARAQADRLLEAA